MTAGQRAGRIAFCHYTADVQGGSDRSLFDLVTHLPPERFRPAMILRRGDPLAAEYRGRGVPVREIAFVPPRRALAPVNLMHFTASLLPTAIQVARAVRALDVALVHVNTINNVQGALGAWLARRPLVWHIREIGKGSVVDRAMLRLVARLATRAVAVSGAVGATLTGCGSRVRRVVNGIDLSEYAELPPKAVARRACGLPPHARVITIIGRVEPWKGQDVALEAFRAVAGRYADAVLLVVGAPSATRPWFSRELRARADRLGFAARVCFTGLRRDVPRLLAASDVLIAPTITAEPFGRTVAEAMAAGVPVIATAAGGPVDMLGDGECGLLVPAQAPAALADAIAALLADPTRAARLGAAGRQRAHERFALPRVIEEMGNVFDEAVVEQPEQHRAIAWLSSSWSTPSR